MRVRAKPEMDGIKMANNPARMSRTLRAMDQLMALGARLARVEGAELMGPPEVVDAGAGDGRRIAYSAVGWRGWVEMERGDGMTMVR